MVVNLGLVYKVQHHSGIIFQFVAFIRKRKRIVPDILAAGGRYDHLVGIRSQQKSAPIERFPSTRAFILTIFLLPPVFQMPQST